MKRQKFRNTRITREFAKNTSAWNTQQWKQENEQNARQPESSAPDQELNEEKTNVDNSLILLVYIESLRRDHVILNTNAPKMLPV